ncbi:MAG: SIMPL domain-containing protein, partial [Microcoleus sp. SIO2G3]|nr:SIMPL domain-containing protein [Microcoleus sp. SIO2G3]
SVSDRQGLMVQGQGVASAPADKAVIEFQVTNSYAAFEEVIEGSSSETPEVTPSEPKPITQATLKPMVDALVNSGIPSSAIEVNASPTGSSSPAFPFPTSSGIAILLVTLNTPTREQVQEIVTIASDPKRLGEDFTIQGINVSYTVRDCQPLEKEAYIAAVNDARNRARSLSEALGVNIAEVPSVAEAPFAGFLPSAPSSCSSQGSSLPFPFSGLQQPYDPSASATVEVKKDIFATYAIR